MFQSFNSLRFVPQYANTPHTVLTHSINNLFNKFFNKTPLNNTPQRTACAKTSSCSAINTALFATRIAAANILSTRLKPPQARRPWLVLLGGLGIILAASQAQASAIFINELHYDNEGSDSNEGIELAGAAGLNIDGWQLQFYNGNNGGVYKSHDLAGTFADQYNGFGIMHIVTGALQNGPADGVALVDSTGNVAEFLSYEGAVTATEGAATGSSSTDIGIAEAVNFPLGMSLQRTGRGSQGNDFSWSAAGQSFGLVNDNQVFSHFVSEVPLPAGGILFASAMGGLLLSGRRATRKKPGLQQS